MEYKVCKYAEENDCYVELWKVLGERRKYVGRYTRPGAWYHVCDPLGYCELDHPFKDDDIFIVCDKDGKELFRSRNGDESANFNTTEQEAHEQMARYMKDHDLNVTVENSHANFYAHWATGTPAGNLNRWLLSFKDPDLYPNADDYDENWIMHGETVGEPETLFTYMFLGEERKIERYRCRHPDCGVEWFEIYSDGYYIGADFDQQHIGTMYTASEARKIISDAIRSHFPDRMNVSYVDSYRLHGVDDIIYQQRKVEIQYAWEKVIGRNFHRAYVDEMAAKEREHSQFYADIWEIRKVYPDCLMA